MDRRDFCSTLASLGLISAAWVNSRCEASPLSTQRKIKWQDDLKVSYKLAVEHDKPMLIVFGASWCTWCHKLERDTLSEKAVAGLIERAFIPVHLDFDEDAKAAEILEVEKLPASVVLSPSADLLLHHVGYAKAPEYTRLLNTSLAKYAELGSIRAASHEKATSGR